MQLVMLQHRAKYAMLEFPISQIFDIDHATVCFDCSVSAWSTDKVSYCDA